MRGNPFTQREINRARRLMDDGCTFRECDEIVGRVRGSVYQKLRQWAYDNSEWEWYLKVKASSAAAGPRRHKIAMSRRRAPSHLVQHRDAVPALSIYAERDRAHSGNPTIGQLLLGEPLRGRSALERRTEDVSA